jgi:hypothetical protein
MEKISNDITQPSDVNSIGAENYIKSQPSVLTTMEQLPMKLNQVLEIPTGQIM